MKDLAIAFLRLGVTAFGGPPAHIAMMEAEFVRRRGWLTHEQFLDLVGAAALMPGPTSTEVALFIGHRRAGVGGLLVAGACFIGPAALMVTAIACVYARYGQLPLAGGALYGIKAVLVAVVVQALIAFGRTAIKSRGLCALAGAAAAAITLGASPLPVLLAAGAMSAVVRGLRRPAGWGGAASLMVPGAAAVTVATMPPALMKLFAIFLKIGVVVFGSGYVLLAFLRRDLVDDAHWITERQLLDAVAVGQFTPGPVFTTATFIGYLIAGVPGAFVATAGIFLPSFLLVAVSGPLLPKVRQSRVAGAFLDGVNVASVALMAVVSVQLGRAALVDLPSIILAVASTVVLFRWRANSAWLVVAGAVLGALLRRGP